MSAKSDDTTPLPEELFEKMIGVLEGPLNDRMERVMKSKLFLAPLGLSWTLGCRSYLMLRDRKISRLWDGGRAPDRKNQHAHTQSAASARGGK